MSSSRNAWDRRRRAVILRDGCCLLCGATAQLTAHHRKARLLHGSSELENLVCLCRPCHDELEMLGRIGAAWIVRLIYPLLRALSRYRLPLLPRLSLAALAALIISIHE